jgi:N-methylhydantoinase A/oxoprolinase/acetone carboxylase beta subunit
MRSSGRSRSSTVASTGARPSIRRPATTSDVFEVGLVARAPKIRPNLVQHALAGETPPDEARLPSRSLFFDGEHHEGVILDLGRLEAGNVVDGPAVVEDPTTTVVVPPDRRIWLDEYRTIWMSAG